MHTSNQNGTILIPCVHYVTLLVYIYQVITTLYDYGHGTNHKCPDYEGVLIFQVSLYDEASFGTITEYMDYAGVLIIFKCPD